MRGMHHRIEQSSLTVKATYDRDHAARVVEAAMQDYIEEFGGERGET
jgi:hypothetical protein